MTAAEEGARSTQYRSSGTTASAALPSAQIADPESALAGLSRRRRSRLAPFRQRNLLAGGLIVFAVILVALFASVIAPRGPQETDYTARLKPPGREHILGTDNLGKDTFSRVVYGARIDLKVGILSVLSPFVIGVLLGSLSGYYGGILDTVLMRVVDVVQAFPFLVLVIAIVAVLGPGLTNMYIAVAMVAWVSYARLLRGEILVAKHREYVEAARAMGMRDPRIIGRHILPNVISSAVVYAMADIILYIVLAASLSYLGLGARPPAPEWGAMIVEGQGFMATAWWTSFFPGLAIVITGIGFSLLGDGLADALRPSRR
jgi:peptide/nickel transport system permease protein